MPMRMFCTTHEAWKNGFQFVHSYGLTSRYKKGRASSHEEARRVQVIYKIRFNFLITGITYGQNRLEFHPIWQFPI